MKRTDELYCVFDVNGEIIGRFLSKYHAVDYMKDYHSTYPNERIFLRAMTVDKYCEYVRRFINRY